jgi:hypothetical protein
MPNVYATPAQIKAALPDAIRATTTKYDAEFLRLAEEVSRFIDNYTHRLFYPRLVTHYFNGNGRASQRIGDWLSITTVSMSDDDGETYTDLAASDWYASVEGDVNSPKSYTHLHISRLSDDYSYFYCGQKSLKVVGVAAYTDDRDNAWEDTTDDVESNPLTSSATSCTVNEAAGAGQWGGAPRFQTGQLLRIESEYCELTDTDQATTLTLARGRNGTTAAEHAQNTQIDVWRPPAPVTQAVIMQLVRGFNRALQGYGDARATPEVSQTIWVRALDPDVIASLAPYVLPVHA